MTIFKSNVPKTNAKLLILNIVLCLGLSACALEPDDVSITAPETSQPGPGNSAPKTITSTPADTSPVITESSNLNLNLNDSNFISRLNTGRLIYVKKGAMASSVDLEDGNGYCIFKVNLAFVSKGKYALDRTIVKEKHYNDSKTIELAASDLIGIKCVSLDDGKPFTVLQFNRIVGELANL